MNVALRGLTVGRAESAGADGFGDEGGDPGTPGGGIFIRSGDGLRAIAVATTNYRTSDGATDTIIPERAAMAAASTTAASPAASAIFTTVIGPLQDNSGLILTHCADAGESGARRGQLQQPHRSARLPAAGRLGG